MDAQTSIPKGDFAMASGHNAIKDRAFTHRQRKRKHPSGSKAPGRKKQWFQQGDQSAAGPKLQHPGPKCKTQVCGE
jgi:hypothetical protein